MINAKVFARSPSAPMTSPDALTELVAVVAQLRDPVGGCPWDLNQTHTSLIPYVLEEAHEVADAIRHGNDDHLCEELGDLLLQVVLHARISEEEGRFDLERVARGIAAKLVRRHPHVFEPHSGGHADWETIKAREKAERGEVAASLSGHLRRKIRGQSALNGAMTISRKAAAAGFEWESMQGVWAKVNEELGELQEAVASGDRAHAQSELGDLLFTLVNVARWVGLDPEEGLAGTNRRFLDRFERVEAALGGDLEGQSIERLEGLWQRAKAELRVEGSD